MLRLTIPKTFDFGMADFRGIENMTVIFIILNALEDYFALGDRNVGFTPTCCGIAILLPDSIMEPRR